jgi:uncharacterized membrane protein
VKLWRYSVWIAGPGRRRSKFAGVASDLVATCRNGTSTLTHYHYLPLSPLFFSILVGVFLALVVFIEVRLLRYAYSRIGIGPRVAVVLLLGSLIGSYFNIPVTNLPGHQLLARRTVTFFGMHYAIPIVINWPGTVIAVNVGGALIPSITSLYLIIKNGLWVRSILATLCVTIVCHILAHPVPGLGIALPVFVPSITAAIVAFLLARRRAAPLAYICGSLGTLIGADLLNLGSLRGLGAPVASIGGAGTFDGIFLIGIVAVLLASLTGGGNEDIPRARR